jgi:hypothetical protein
LHRDKGVNATPSRNEHDLLPALTFLYSWLITGHYGKWGWSRNQRAAVIPAALRRQVAAGQCRPV